MGMNSFALTVTACAMACLGVAYGDTPTTFVWNAAGSGGWQSKSQYFMSDGTTPAADDPKAGDIVVIDKPVSVGVTTDAEAAFVNGLGGVDLVDGNAEFVFAQPSDIVWRCPVFRNGRIRKTTVATVEFEQNSRKDFDRFYSYCAYLTLNGLIIEKGTVLAPQDVSATGQHAFGPLALSNDTTFVVSANGSTFALALCGYGTVTNRSSSSSTFIIGSSQYESPWYGGHFYGHLSGTGLRPLFVGTTYLHATDNGFKGGSVIVQDRDDLNSDTRGILGVAFFGRYAPSSIGNTCDIESRTGGKFLYLGSGEETTRAFTWRPGPIPAEVDGGVYGDLRFDGSWSQFKESGGKMARLLLSGDHQNPCKVSGKISTGGTSSGGKTLTTYIAKEGTGTWRFSNVANEQTGALAIRNGTFQFDSIAEKGRPCALGLSTVLQDDYYGNYDESKDVGYAFLLGGANAFPTFEYVGGQAAFCATRPLALTGMGGRLSSSGSGSALTFAGVFANESGEKVLTLGGDSTAGNVLSNVTDGAGSVALEKDGAGTWALRGVNKFSGTLRVREGRLEIRDRFKKNYSWYRFVIRGANMEGGICYGGRLALYDAAGSNHVANMTYRLPDGASGRIEPIPPQDLLPGEATLYGGHRQKEDKSYYPYGTIVYPGAGSDLSKCFKYDSAAAGSAWKCTIDDMVFPDYPGYIAVRLREGTPAITHVDFASGSYLPITKFSVDGSFDGVNWEPLTDLIEPDPQYYADHYHWLSGDDYVKDNPLRPGRGFALGKTGIEEPDEGGAHVIDGVESVQVDAGATLEVLGVRKTVAGLTVDGAKGGGSIRGIDFAADGTLTFENVTGSPEKIVQPVDLADVTDEDLENLNGYQVRFGGRVRNYGVKVTRSSVTVEKRGLLILFR